MEKSGDVRALLDEKRKLLLNVLEASVGFKFTGADDDAEKYIKMIDARERVFVKLKGIDAELSKHKLSAETEPLLAEIKKIAKRISDIDVEISKGVPKVMSALKNNIKGLNAGRNVAKQYQSQYYGEVSRFDKSQ